MTVHIVRTVAVAVAALAALFGVGALLALLTQPRNPVAHLDLVDADGDLCCGTTDHRIWR